MEGADVGTDGARDGRDGAQLEQGGCRHDLFDGLPDLHGANCVLPTTTVQHQLHEDHIFRTGGSNLTTYDEAKEMYRTRCPRDCGEEFPASTEEGRRAFRNHLEQCKEGLLESSHPQPEDESFVTCREATPDEASSSSSSSDDDPVVVEQHCGHYWVRCPKNCGAEFCVDEDLGRNFAPANHTSESDGGRRYFAPTESAALRGFQQHLLENCKHGLVEPPVDEDESCQIITFCSGHYWIKCPKNCGAEFCVEEDRGRNFAPANHFAPPESRAFQQHLLENCGKPVLETSHESSVPDDEEPSQSTSEQEEDLYVEAWTKFPSAHFSSGGEQAFRMSGRTTHHHVDAYFCTGVNMGSLNDARPTIKKPLSDGEARWFRHYGDEGEWNSHAAWTRSKTSSLDNSRAMHALQKLVDAHVDRALGSLYDAHEKPADLLKPNWFDHQSSSLLNKFFEQYQHDVNRFEGHTTSKRLTNSRQFARLMKLITKEEHVERFRGAIVAGRNKTRVWSWRGSELKFDLFLPEADTAGTVLVYITADGRIWENAEEILVSARRSAFSRIWNEPEENLTDPTEAEDPLVDVLVLGYYKTPADRATLPLWHAPEPEKKFVWVGHHLDTVTETNDKSGPESWRPFSSWSTPHTSLVNPALDYPGVFHIRATSSTTTNNGINMVEEVGKMVTASLERAVPEAGAVRVVVEASIRIEETARVEEKIAREEARVRSSELGVFWDRRHSRSSELGAFFRVRVRSSELGVETGGGTGVGSPVRISRAYFDLGSDQGISGQE